MGTLEEKVSSCLAWMILLLPDGGGGQCKALLERFDRFVAAFCGLLDEEDYKYFNHSLQE
jgi:hypothetical protein